MTRFVVTAAVSLVVHLAASAAGQVITQWTFNSRPPDANPLTGTITPAIGTGTFGATIGMNVGFAPGAAEDPDDAGGDNTSYFTYGYPLQGRESGGRGITVRASTEGYTGILVALQQQNAVSTSAWWRFEYTLDGVTFSSAGLPTMEFGAPGEYVVPIPLAGGWVAYSWDLSAIPGVANNPNFGFRTAAVFAPDTNKYVSAGVREASSYRPAETVRFDLISIRAAPTHQALCCRGSTCLATTSVCIGANTLVIPGVGTCNAAGNARTPCCKPDFNHVNGITVQDIFDFLAAWFAGDTGADFNGTAPSAAGVTVQDIFDFLAAWFAKGC